MLAAIAQAERAFASAEVPVGCVIVEELDDGPEPETHSGDGGATGHYCAAADSLTTPKTLGGRTSRLLATGFNWTNTTLNVSAANPTRATRFSKVCRARSHDNHILSTHVAVCSRRVTRNSLPWKHLFQHACQMALLQPLMPVAQPS